MRAHSPRALWMTPSFPALLRPPTMSKSVSPKCLRFNQTVEVYEHPETETESPSNAAPPRATAPVLHSTLRPGECSPLDFSLPADVFIADPRLDNTLLTKSACTPPQREVYVRVPSANGPRGLCNIGVAHSPATECVTVGDVLTAIHNALRQKEVSVEKDVRRHHERRVATLEQYCSALDKPTRAKIDLDEATGGTRRVDQLRGNVLFAGIIVPSPEVPSKWELRLEFSERYA
ncbi:hypothetical protein B0H14DRAFT_829729 [Mycena olivaceomarginata]|nr:hypothetical protein B0H14DRAFT_829729 [Mycena olivaceomarginata]